MRDRISHAGRNRHRQQAAQVISAMQRGASLHLHYENGRALWRLSTGSFVTAEAAALVAAHRAIVGCDDALFEGMTGQTLRYVEAAS